MHFTKKGRIKTAGGVVVRGDGGRGLEVLLVHRPHYRDWTFPKGKADPGERWRHAAHREVLEETGFDCRLERKLGKIVYHDRKGRAKEVRYWMMTVVGGEFTPNEEVDAIEWCTLAEAARLLTYPRDRQLLDALPRPAVA